MWAYLIGGELLRSEEEGGEPSIQYFIKYVSSLSMLKMYRKCTNAPFAFFLMLSKTLSPKHDTQNFNKKGIPLRFRELIILPTQKSI